jgi:Ca2+-binding RTX toxin-like protein
MNMTSNFVDQNQAYGTGTLVGTFLRAGDGQGGSAAALMFGDPDPSNPAFDLLPTLRQLIEEHWANDTLFADGEFQTSFRTYHAGLVAEDGTIDATMVKEMASDFMGSGQPLLLDTNPFINLLDHVVAGDGRVNENVTLTSIHTIWARNHNFHVENLKAAGFEGSAEELYQAAKIINESEYARVVWTDFTDMLLGGMRGVGNHGWAGYNPDANPGISQEFAAAGYRFGHSLIQQTVRVLNAQGEPVDVTLFDAFLNPSNDASVFTLPIEQLQARGYNPQPGYAELGANAIIGGIINQPAEEVDANIVDAVRNDLVRINADLFSFNVARGRDLGLGTMNQVREALANSTDPYVREAVSNVAGGLSPYASWEDFQARNNLSNEVIEQFKQAYPDLVLETQEAIDAFVAANPDIVLVDGNTVKGIDRVDLWVGGLTEAHVNGGVVGSTFWVILHEQFDRLQEADRFYYLDRTDNFDFYANNINGEVEGFVQIVARNTGLTNLPERVFEVAQVPGGLDPVTDTALPPVEEVPPVDGAVTDAPATETNAPKSPVEETPAPVAEEPAAPVEETPAPVVEEPIAPAKEIPALVVEEPVTPVEETPAPVVEEPAAPVEETPVVEEPVSLDQTGTSRSEVLLGAAGDDVLFGMGGHDRLHGGAGDDMLIGGRGRDMLFGEDGMDTLLGGAGADYLDGGEGADVLFGGKGSDTFMFGDGDLVLDFRSGDDLIDLTALGITEATFEEQVSFTSMGNDTMISVGSQSMTLKNTQQVDMDDFSLAEETAIDKLLSDALAVIESQSPSPVANVGGDESSPVADRAMLADLPPYPMLESGMLPIRPLEDDFITPMM